MISTLVGIILAILSNFIFKQLFVTPAGSANSRPLNEEDDEEGISSLVINTLVRPTVKKRRANNTLNRHIIRLVILTYLYFCLLLLSSVRKQVHSPLENKDLQLTNQQLSQDFLKLSRERENDALLSSIFPSAMSDSEY